MPSPDYRDPLQNRDPKQAAKEEARAVWSDTKDTARAMLGEQQKAAAGGMNDLAGALRKAAREMGDGAREQPLPRLLDTAADGLERFSGALRGKDLNGLVADVEGFARRQPVAFFGAAMMAGFLAVRFLKASNEANNAPASNALGGERQDLPY